MLNGLLNVNNCSMGVNGCSSCSVSFEKVLLCFCALLLCDGSLGLCCCCWGCAALSFVLEMLLCLLKRCESMLWDDEGTQLSLL